ncbi:alpha/beta hydrolase [Solwaraspora sp. WMMD1047]|uniref:alpha/beta fold hydrolase n=1 Tax=Solwaraspora sp. WMMD1047 TaxID=3016102 RepID=UPI0024161AC7|nr:alpha/beta hydrolase [Solwaraspora sp. WMMD1047]MDG4830348.1 alpha/beta hydrolase [Solwaraspora sp. WMMD1047]
MASFVLVPGFWLGGWAWSAVSDRLRAAGHDVHPVTLTGVGDRAHLAGPQVTLETHVDDLVGLIESADLRQVILVGHSGGGMPACLAAQRVPERIARLIYLESGPLPDGVSQFDTNPPAERDRLRALIGSGHLLPPPPWQPADDPANLAGLDDQALTTLRERTTPHPVRAATDPVRRTGPLPVPTALIACTFPLAQVRELIAQGHPYFAELADADLYALPTGHWPMFSKPDRLADLLDGISGP